MELSSLRVDAERHGRAKVYELMACGALRSFRVDGCRRVRTDDLVAFVANLDERWPEHVCTRGQEPPHIPGPGDQLYVSGAAFPFRAPRADPEQARTEAGNLTYEKTDWPTFQMSDQLPVWVDLLSTGLSDVAALSWTGGVCMHELGPWERLGTKTGSHHGMRSPESARPARTRGLEAP